MSNAIRLLLAEDERLTRENLARLLALEDDIEIVGTAADGEEAVGLARTRAPHVLLTDIQMPRKTGIEVTQILKPEMPDLGIVVLTIYHDDANVFAAIKAGAMGYVLKDGPLDDTLAAVRAVARGEALLHPSIAARVIAEFNKVRPQTPAKSEKFAELSERELEVLKTLASGKRNKQIADALFISEKTVKNHVSAILWKLQVNSRAEAALLAAKEGLA
ncbi:MAG: response regulator transcription factor [Armatimonadetes bacterium]|nr:response regulator transcription factor [Armatimonadota bacterium]